MSTDFITPVCRIVQTRGSLVDSHDKTDDAGNVKLKADGSPIKENWFNLAIPKQIPNNPNHAAELQTFLNVIFGLARQNWPQAFDPNGKCINPSLALKIHDADVEYDNKGVLWGTKEGCAGCWVLKVSTSIPDMLTVVDIKGNVLHDQTSVKCGDWVKLFGNISVNPGGAGRKSGLYVNPRFVYFVASGEPIVSGPSASEIASAMVGHVDASMLPPGAAVVPTTAPVAAAPAPAPVAVAPAPAPVAPPAPAPAPAANPQIIMTPKANGATLDQFLALSWTIEALIAEGYAEKSPF